MRLIKRANFPSRRERLKYCAVELLAIVDALIFFCTLTTCVTHLKATVLFSEWLEDND